MLVSDAFAHGGGLDSSGGHNCYVGSCAGSYHYHRGSGSSSNEGDDSLAWIIIALFIAGMMYPFVKNIPKVIFPELRSDAEKRYWDADEGKEKAKKEFENQAAITSKVRSDYAQNATVVTEVELEEAEEKLKKATEKSLAASEEYDIALRFLHLEDEEKKRMKRIQKFKKK